ncbi:MAG: ATP-binding protein [Candidatus Omnitrophota bacterium]
MKDRTKKLDINQRFHQTADPGENTREQISFYAKILSNSAQATAIMDNQGFYVSQNRQHEKMIGYSIDELKGKTAAFHLGKKSFYYIIKDLMNFGIYHGEVESATKSGAKVYFDLFVFRVLNQSGQVLCYVGIKRDISEQKKIEKLLTEQEQRTNVILNNMQSMIYIKNVRGEYIFVNKQFEKFFNVELKDIYGKIDNDIFIPQTADILKKDDLTILEKKESLSILQSIIGEYGPVFFACRKFPLYGEKDEIFAVCGVLTDISEKKKLKEDVITYAKVLEETKSQLIQSNKLATMGQLVAGIAHELNQPLTGIKGFAQLALKDLDKTHILEKDLEKIIEQADRIDNIIQNVRSYAHKSNNNLIKININEPVEEILLLLKEQLKGVNIQVEKNLGKDLPFVRADKNQLQQVFTNLIVNAKDAMAGNEFLNGRILFLITKFNKKTKNIEMFIKDTGCGINKEKIKYIFEPFFSTKAGEKGLGLGLSIVSQIIQEHNGKIEVESQEGKGTTFKIILPSDEE